MKIMELKLDEIKVDRQVFEENIDLEALKKSIQDAGMVYNLVVEEENGEYYLRDGYGRYKVLKELGYDRANCIIISDNIKAIALAYDLNLLRRHLPDERIRYYKLQKKAKIQEKLNALKEKIAEKIDLQSDSIDLEEDELKVIFRLSEKETEIFWNAVEKIYRKKYENEINSLISQRDEKERKIKELENKTVDIEKLQRMVQEKLAEKEKELEQKIKKQLASESEQERIAYEEEIERLKEIIESYKSDIAELNRNLIETTKIIDQLKKEKEAFEEEKRKIQEKEKIAEDFAMKYRSEIEYLKKIEIKNLQNKIKQQEDFLKSISRPESIILQLNASKNMINSALEIVVRIYDAIPEEERKKIVKEVSEITELLKVIEETIKNGEPVDTVEIAKQNN
ncbi:ParB N-terminal domain-containing protein [Thermodesulfovibrio sp. 3907-1M]|uniref:ParB N-terminal domain-containing protein n=1 Tax=Thermodesulfovibrio autotrophicus TaxID=3118333 RepID=A0AAU8GWP5_9BACT